MMAVGGAPNAPVNVYYKGVAMIAKLGLPVYVYCVFANELMSKRSCY